MGYGTNLVVGYSPVVVGVSIGGIKGDNLGVVSHRLVILPCLCMTVSPVVVSLDVTGIQLNRASVVICSI